MKTNGHFWELSHYDFVHSFPIENEKQLDPKSKQFKVEKSQIDDNSQYLYVIKPSVAVNISTITSFQTVWINEPNNYRALHQHTRAIARVLSS